MTEWITGHVVEKKQWNDKLYSLRVDAKIPSFVAGQFTRLGLHIDGELVSRPFSLVNAPDEFPLDFYFIEVLGGKLSTRLSRLEPGDEVMIASRAAGLLTLQELPPARHLFLLSTGTGIGPFLSIIKTPEPWARFEKVVLVHAVRVQSELNYQETIQKALADHPQQFVYIPFVSREACDFALAGRVPQAIADGRLEARAGIVINAADTQVMLCGNPAMLRDTTEALIARGLKRHKRREPGQISQENYW